MHYIDSEAQKFKSKLFHGVFLRHQRHFACKVASIQNIERFPYPPHIIWDAPIIPSLTVPYGITRDYFYSGHTGLMLFCSYLWKNLGYKALYWPSLVLTPVVILVLLSTRVHYSIDIVAAIVFTFWIEGHLLKYVIVLDKFFSFAFGLLERAFHWIRKTIA